MRYPFALLAVFISLAASNLPAAPPPAEMVDFPMIWTPDAPGAFDVAPLLDKPAGRLGPVVARDGHFYTGDKRIRFWGVNICFGGCFPTHEQADRTAARLAHFGINAVRFHHMDNQKYPRGIWADDKKQTLSPEALDRLDYFIAALKKQGVYSNINLHVSRDWTKTNKWENADKLPQSYDKILDIFHPDLIAANKQYARDLLTHVNKYTGNSYAAEPAVCMVEINNEDTIFLWGGEQGLAKLPEPYASLLTKLWNQWLLKKYNTREKLAAAWMVGASPLGQNQLAGKWNVEGHNGAAMKASVKEGTHELDVTKLSGTDWHAQYSTPGLKIARGQYYTVSFTVSADKDRNMGLGITMAHDPWHNLGFSTVVKLTTTPKAYRYGFIATEDDENGRVSFTLGSALGKVTLSDVQLRAGGQEGLRDDEDPAKNTVVRNDQGISAAKPRSNDWYDFLQYTDESYWVNMRDFLRNELKVKAPITGTIGLGPLGTMSQAKMDFVDAHAYWDHPHFPRRPWDGRDWTLSNKPMVDNPQGATLWRLAAIRVQGLPFTVTEYNHGHPNEWQAETMPLIAAYAALQDWDGIFIFSYDHSGQHEKTYGNGFFDIEGNPLKMLAMPIAAKIFLGMGVQPLAAKSVLTAHLDDIHANASETFWDLWRFHQRVNKADWKLAFNRRIETRFEAGPRKVLPVPPPESITTGLLDWTSDKSGSYTGRFTMADPHGVMFVGFAQGAMPVGLGDISIQSLSTPFAAITLAPVDITRTIRTADRLILCAMARGDNTGMKWNDTRNSVSADWGKAPTRIEVVKGTLKLPADYTVRALDSAGKVIKEFSTQNQILNLGEAPTVWYELIRK